MAARQCRRLSHRNILGNRTFYILLVLSSILSADTTSVGNYPLHKAVDIRARQECLLQQNQFFKAERDIFTLLGKTLIRLYQVVFSTHQGEVCNFTPSCSNYSYQSIEKYGLLGVIMAADRLERCHYFAWQDKDKHYKAKWVEKRGNKLYDPVK